MGVRTAFFRYRYVLMIGMGMLVFGLGLLFFLRGQSQAGEEARVPARGLYLYMKDLVASPASKATTTVAAGPGILWGDREPDIVPTEPIYYVDPKTGNNANAGTSAKKPWKNPPGTRTADNEDFYGTAWGDITMKKKIQCGNTILLKGGSMQTAKEGGAWRIDNGSREDGTGFYSHDCREGKPITLRVARPGEWSASKGDFILDGAGMVATCLTFCGDTHALVHVQDIDTLRIGGASPGQRLVLRNAAAGGITAHDLLITSSKQGAGATARVIAEWLDASTAHADGVAIGPAQQVIVRTSTAHDNGRSGFSTGTMNDNRVTGVAFQDAEAYGNGKGGDVFAGDQFFFLGCESCYLIRAKSHDALLRGLNYGTVKDFGRDMFLLIRDSAFWNNGLSRDNQNVYQSGPCWSGDDRSGGRIQRGVMQRSIMFRNHEAGGPCAYGQGWAEVWNSVWWGNGWNKDVGGTGDIALAGRADAAHFGVFNSMVQKRSYNVTWTASGPSNFVAVRCPVSDYNLYIPAIGDGEVLSDFECRGKSTFRAGDRTYKNPPDFIGDHDRTGAKFSAGFVATSDKEYSVADFHLTRDSSAIDAGTAMMRAKASSTGATTTIPVVGNAGSADPRHYFLSPASYYQAGGDTVQIKGASCDKAKEDLGSGERGRIVSMTGKAITLDRSCTWQKDAGIHLPWSGGAPDMGVFEFGS